MANDFHLNQVRRLGGMEFPPQTPQAWSELAKVLKRYSKSEEHASRILDRFFEADAPTRCPTPGELAGMAGSVPAKAEHDRPTMADPCDECAPFGGTFREVLRDNDGITITAMERCRCARGEKLKAMDAARPVNR